VITSQDLQLLRVGISEVFFQNFGKPSFYEKVFTVKDSKQEYEEYLHIAGLPNLMEWNSDGGELPVVAPIQGSRVFFLHKDYGYMWTISKRLLRGNQYRDISAELSRSAGQSALHTVEALATAVLADGFTVNGFDGVPLFGNHPLLGGGTYTNKLTSALSNTSLQDAITKFRRTVNHRGQPVVIEPKYLVVPPELEFTALTLVNSTVVPVTSGFATDYTNPLKGVAQVIVNPYLTDANDWFLIAEKGDQRLIFFWREKPTIHTETDFRTQGISTAINMALSVGYLDWIGLVGSSVV
jgi:phage major head subunit gpT-like protein